jgi:hypothetical protein
MEKKRKAVNEDVFDFLVDIRDADGNRPGPYPYSIVTQRPWELTIMLHLIRRAWI